jgi:hypothetical protein
MWMTVRIVSLALCDFLPVLVFQMDVTGIRIQAEYLSTLPVKASYVFDLVQSDLEQTVFLFWDKPALIETSLR